MSVAITNYLAGGVFEPAQAEAMGEAFEMLCNWLRLDKSRRDAATSRVAEAVIEAAASGSASADEIMEGAMRTLRIG